MEINIVPVEGEALLRKTKAIQVERHGSPNALKDSCRIAFELSAVPQGDLSRIVGDTASHMRCLQVQTPPAIKVFIEQIFAEFLEMEVGDGAASADTIKSYLCQSKMYFAWCKDNLVPILEADQEDIKLYRQYLIEKGYKTGTIANKLSIVHTFYKAAIAKGLIATNPAAGVKAPTERVDPASNISFLELDELELLLGEIESQLNQAKTNKQRLPLLRDLALVGIMSLEGCRTVELHNLKLEQILHQGSRTGIKVFAKRASRIVPLTDTLTEQLEEYLLMRRTVLRRKIKPEDYVFVSVSNNSKGRQLSRRSIRAIVDRYLIATKLKHKQGRTLSAHSLRHTAGTQALRAGADLRQVQDLLGHADPRTTSIYAHVGDRWEYNPAAAVEKNIKTKPVMPDKPKFKL
jgi:site-specific recombinase XerD